MQPVTGEAPASPVLINPLTIQDVDVSVTEAVSALFDAAISRVEFAVEKIARQRELRGALLSATNVRTEIDSLVANATDPMSALLAQQYIAGCRLGLIADFKTVNPTGDKAMIEKVVDDYLEAQLAKIPGLEAAPEPPPVKKARGKG